MDFEKHHSIALMGTTIDLMVDHPNSNALLLEAVKRLFQLEARFSANDPSSELMAVNQAAGLRPVQVHPELFHLIQVGKKESVASGRKLNIAIGPLVNLWRIGFTDYRIPSQAEIDDRLNLVDPNDIHLDEAAKTVYLAKPGMAIDLGALAKGYSADQIIAYFKAQGVQRASINLGGNLKFYGHRPKHTESNQWRIGIQDPDQTRGQNKAVVALSDHSVVTSGDYVRVFEHDGQRYHHILDSVNGKPFQTEVRSVTVVSESSLDGEIWTTRLFPLDKATIMRQAEENPAIEVLVVDRQGQVTYTSGLEGKVALIR
ncbi:FAD:protein FMN transferase [Aerococcaceae bacterium 50-4]